MIEIILDTETTGLSVKEGHRIVEIGCLEIENLVPTKKVFHQYINPEGKKVDESALKVHGYTDEFLKGKKKFKEIATEFLNFIKDKRLVIHNADFDITHLNNELSLLGLEKINPKYVVDTLEIARNKFPGSSASLDALCKRYRIDNSRRTKHSAIIDCELLHKVYVNLLDQKEPSLDFNDNSDTNHEIISENEISKYLKQVIKPTENEISQHKIFLKTYLKKNYY